MLCEININVCFSQKKSYQAKQLMSLVFKVFFRQEGRSSRGPNMPERLCERLGESWFDIAGLRSSPHCQESSVNATSTPRRA